MNELVSVIVTCYNHEEYIKQCLESIEFQTYQNVELFIFNDGSTDSSEQVIKEFLDKTSLAQVNYYYHENRGLVKTRNRAFDYINGEFLLFVDSDNYLKENYIEELLKTAHKNSGDIIYTRLINPENNTVVLPLQDFSLSRLFKSNFIDSCSLIRKSIIGSIRYDDYLNGKRLEDFDFFLSLIVNNQAKAVPCEKTFFYYRILEDSMSGRARNLILKYYQAYVYILGKYTDIYPKEVQAASDLHFDRNINLAYYNQKVKVYYHAENESFLENKVIDYDLKPSCQLVLDLPDNITHLRIDLSELPSFYKRVSLVEKEHQTELLPSGTNGMIVKQYVMFANSDPQLFYDISKIAKKSFILTYEMFNVDDIIAPNYIGKVLVQDIKALFTQVEELEKYKNKYQIVQKACDNYKQQLEEMIVRYNSVVHSRRWIIPTNIINLFRRNK